MSLLIRLTAAGSLVAFVAGCAQMVAPPYAADYATLDRLRDKPVEKLSVSTFQPVDAAAAVNKVSLRGASMYSPSGSFAKYLEDALIGDLKEISLYDPESRTRIDAKLLANDIDITRIDSGSGVMTVELTVSRSGTQRLRKTYTAKTTFESSFAGAVAIPKGQTEYPGLVRALLREVYADPEFSAAIAKN